MIEYNKENFSDIDKLLKNYEKYIYDIESDNLVKLRKQLQSRISRTSKTNLLSSRNIYFVPK